MITRISVALDFGSVEVPLGTLGWDDRAGLPVFEWASAFRSAPLPVSPFRITEHGSLLRATNRSAFDGLPGLFGDSLPDGWGHLLVDREIARRGLGPVTVLDRLAMVGCHGMGALTYEPDEAPEPAPEIDLDWFARLVPEVQGAATADELERLRAVAGGSQGARPKFVAQLSAEGAHLRHHRHPPETGWRPVLVKRRAETDPPGSVEAEAGYADMARAAGIDMAWTGLLTSNSGEPFFATERFDRPTGRRLHMQSAAALLDADFRSDLIDYADLIQLTRHVTRDIRAAEAMLRRMVFNILAMNRDDHLKNHAFLMDARGNWSLAPAFDLSFSRGAGGHHALTVAGDSRAPGRDAIFAVAERAGLRHGAAADAIDSVESARAAWPEVAERHHVPPVLAEEIAATMPRL